MEHEQTVGEFLDKFDGFRESKTTVIIHPGFKYGFLEISKEFRDELKQAFIRKLRNIEMGLEEPDPITQFAVMILQDAY